jgi:hypothetical protein
MTATPQMIPTKMVRTGAAPNVKPIRIAQQPLTTMKRLVTTVLPHRSADQPPTKAPSAPDPIIAKVTRFAPTGSFCCAAAKLATTNVSGSTVAGGSILKTIGSTQIKPMTLELGGKSPQILFGSADIGKAAERVARRILINAGQTCVAGTRVIVDRRISGAS